MDKDIDISKLLTWANRTYTIGLLTEKQFKKFTKGKKLVEMNINELFVNDSLVFWKRDFFYDKKLFLEMKKLASCLGNCTIALMPDTKKCFPMFMVCDSFDSGKFYVVLAPKDVSETKEYDDSSYLDVYFPKGEKT